MIAYLQLEVVKFAKTAGSIRGFYSAKKLDLFVLMRTETGVVVF